MNTGHNHSGDNQNHSDIASRNRNNRDNIMGTYGGTDGNCKYVMSNKRSGDSGRNSSSSSSSSCCCGNSGGRSSSLAVV